MWTKDGKSCYGTVAKGKRSKVAASVSKVNGRHDECRLFLFRVLSFTIVKADAIEGKGLDR